VLFERIQNMIVVLGGAGYVGQSVVVAARQRGLAVRSISRAEADYSQAGQLRSLLQQLRPRALINAAGFTGRPNVDACELAKTECLAGNAVLPGVVRGVCEELGIPWGHVSSGCIYTGSKADATGFTELDPPNFSFRQNNCSFYSGCKALGEEVLEGARQCWIWRLRIPFCHRDSGRNYISKLLRYRRLLDARNSLSQLDEFAAACVDCIERQVPFGTYHLTNPGSVTTREVVDLIRTTGLADREFDFFASEDQFLEQAAKTPRSNCVLDTEKATAAGLRMTPIREALEKAMRGWVWE
jgi:dTDP-4-dehydrorhamnose reductase